MPKKGPTSKAAKKFVTNGNRELYLNMFTPGGGHYIFFKSLLDSENSSLRGLGNRAKQYLQQASDRLNISKSNKIDEDLDYIRNFINALRDTAQRERYAEYNLFSKLQQKEIKEYIDINQYWANPQTKFDYINFMKEINQFFINEKLLDNVIAINIKKINANEKAIEKFAQTKINNDETQKTTPQKIIDAINNTYITNFNQYVTTIRKQYESKIPLTLAGQIAQRIDDIMKNLINNNDFITQLDQNNIDPEKIFNAIIVYVINHFKQGSLEDFPNLESQIETIIKNCHKDFITKTNSDIDKIITNFYAGLKKIVDAAVKEKGGIANILLEEEELYIDLKNVFDTLTANIDKQKGKYPKEIQQAKQQMDKAYNYLKNSNNDFSSTQKGKWSLTYNVNKLFKLIFHFDPSQIQQEKTLQRQQIDTITNQILSNITKGKTNEELIRFYFQTHQIKGYDIEEYLSKPGVMNTVSDQIIKNFNTSLQGKDILLKADLVFSYTPTDVSDFIEKHFSNSPITLEPSLDILKTMNQRFLTEYYNKYGNQTNVTAAQEVFIEEYKKIITARNTLIASLNNDSDKKKAEELFNQIINGGISAKNYEFYNNTKGFKGGSLGREGKLNTTSRATGALDNIYAMLESGGIDVKDKDLILDTLLNCFDDSVIGREPFEDIKNLLLGGAAMVMFDDGFANQKAFLDKLKELNITSSNVVHLLGLNGNFFPYSYVIFNIVEQLELIYQDILEEVNTNITDGKRADLILINNLKEKPLLDKYENAETPQIKWDSISKYALDHVKLKFLFMGGILDILQRLSDIKPQV